MSTSAQEIRDARLLASAEEITVAAAQLATAYRDLADCLREYRREAFTQAGRNGADDVANVASDDRMALEVIGALLAAGCEPLFRDASLHVPHIQHVPNLAGRWQERLDRGQLVTRRTR